MGDRLAQPIHVAQGDVGLPERNCDAGLVESFEDGDPQIRARAAGLGEVVDERAELEIETVGPEILEIHGGSRRPITLGLSCAAFSRIAFTLRGSEP